MHIRTYENYRDDFNVGYEVAMDTLLSTVLTNAQILAMDSKVLEPLKSKCG